MEITTFSYVLNPVGTLSGTSFKQQTEDAINALAQQVNGITEDNNTLSIQVQQAVSTANSALSTANSALTTSESTQQQLETLSTTVAGYDQKITQAVSQSASAVQTATTAQTSSQQAQEAAQQAQTASEQSASQAQQAQEAAQSAQQQAEAAQTAAEAAQGQASNAANTAQNAQEQAQNAQQSAENAAASAAQMASSSVMVTEQTWSADATLTGTTSAEALSVSGSVTATGGFVGNLTGTASQATADGNGNNIVNTYATIANTYTKAQVDAKVASVYRIMGSVATYDDLPSSGQTVGDVYNVIDTGANYVWTSSGWDKLSETVDLSNYLTIDSAQGTYLTIANAQSTYLSKTTAASTYLSQANAQTIYLSQAAASTTYLTQANAQSLYLPVTGGTLTGALTLAADPTTSMGAATKQYVDSAVSTGSSNAVLFTAQSLSEQQQQQACTNINAMPAADLIAVCNEIAGVS